MSSYEKNESNWTNWYLYIFNYNKTCVEILQEKLSIDTPINNQENQQQSHVSFNTEKNKFNYEEFLNKKLKQKIESNSYRIFKRINRNVESFPFADSYDTCPKINEINSTKPNKVMVWCSNDYLGLSRHSLVIENAKFIKLLKFNLNL